VNFPGFFEISQINKNNASENHQVVQILLKYTKNKETAASQNDSSFQNQPTPIQKKNISLIILSNTFPF
jgi:hypothetical protein